MHGHALAQEPMPQGSGNFLVNPSFVIVTVNQSFMSADLCSEVEKRIFKEIKHLQYDLKILTQ